MNLKEQYEKMTEEQLNAAYKNMGDYSQKEQKIIKKIVEKRNKQNSPDVIARENSARKLNNRIEKTIKKAIIIVVLAFIALFVLNTLKDMFLYARYSNTEIYTK